MANSYFFSLALNDFRQVFRDASLRNFLAMPFLSWALLYWAWPYLLGQYPALSPYTVYVLMFAGFQAAVMFGFIWAFVILDEKDEGLMPLFQILPISPRRFLLYRLFLAYWASVLGSALVILGNGFWWPGWDLGLLLSLLYGLVAPMTSVLVGTLARNKIEGMAYFKGFDLLLLLPVVGLYINQPWTWAFGLLPVYWIYQTLAAIYSGTSYGLFALAALGSHGLYLWVLLSWFERRL